MSRPALLIVLVLAAALGASAATGEAGGEAAGDATQAADRQLLEQVLGEGGVETAARRPRVSEYLGDLTKTAVDGLNSWLSGLTKVDAMLAAVIKWLLAVLTLAVVVMMALQLARVLSRRRRVEPAPAAVSLPPSPSETTDWPQELNARLEAGDAAGALEALWWWLAASLGLSEADEAWTTRELALRAGRRDLLPAVRHYDRLVYGGGTFAVADVRRQWQNLRQQVEAGGD